MDTDQRSPKRFSLGEWLLNHRWGIVVLTSLSIFVFEWLEYQPALKGAKIGFFEEVIFFGILLPLSTGIALSWAATSRSELSWLNYYQNLTNNLVIQLHNAHSHYELARVLLGFFQVTMPLSGTTLYAYDQDSQKYKVILNWRLNEDSRASNPITESKTESGACFKRKPGALLPCRDLQVSGSSPGLLCFCIPFLFSDSPVGGAHLFFAPNSVPSPEQYRLLEEVVPTIAAEFQRIQLELTIKKRNHSLGAEQQRIARDVHDTLGHSLAFLRLRLDHISMEFDQPGMDKMRKEVEALRDVAKEAYDQMRDVLNQLNAESDSRLGEVLSAYADKISQRASFEVAVQHDGWQRDLPPSIHRNVFYIFREILTNAEKHAQAQHVEVSLKWHEACLELEVKDDGVGFSPWQSMGNGHFGIRNMQERADEIQAQFSIFSHPNHGARHILRIPYEVSYEINRRGRSLALSQWSGQPL